MNDKGRYHSLDWEGGTSVCHFRALFAYAVLERGFRANNRQLILCATSRAEVGPNLKIKWGHAALSKSMANATELA
jgi:hypothetical protein